MSKHTPGPWTYYEWPGAEGCPHPRIASPGTGGPLPLAEVWDGQGLACGFGGHLDEIRANARLIAAAPDMLAALRVAREGLSAALVRTGLDDVIAAIAKAGG